MLNYEVHLRNGAKFWCKEFGRVRDIRTDDVPDWVNPDVDFAMIHAILRDRTGFPIRPIDVVYILDGVVLAFKMHEPKTCLWDETIEGMVDEIEGAE